MTPVGHRTTPITSRGDVDVDSVGNRLMAGAFVGSIDFGAAPVASAGLSDGFAAKLAPDGTPASGRAIGDAANPHGAAVAVDHQDRVALFGTFEGTVGFGGSNLTADGDRDLYLALLDSSKVHVHSPCSMGAQYYCPGSAGGGTCQEGSVHVHVHVHVDVHERATGVPLVSMIRHARAARAAAMRIRP